LSPEVAGALGRLSCTMLDVLVMLECGTAQEPLPAARMGG
jgi:hypothetical protein